MLYSRSLWAIWFILKIFIYLCTGCTGSQLQHSGASVFSRSTWDPVLWPGVILGPLPWECGIVTTWSSGKSLLIYFIYNYVFMLIPNQSCPHSAWHIASTQHILKNNSSNRWIIFLCFSISLWCFCEPQGQCIYIATPTNSHLPIHLSMYPSICIFLVNVQQ